MRKTVQRDKNNVLQLLGQSVGQSGTLCPQSGALCPQGWPRLHTRAPLLDHAGDFCPQTLSLVQF